MFKRLKESIISLNNGVNTVANSDKAKQLRKKLLCIGLPMAIVGYIGVFICFILFVTTAFASVESYGFPSGILVPFFLIIPFALLGGIGTTITSLGLKIVITGYTSKLIDDTVGNNCPKCGDEITENEIFCSNCGEVLKKECEKCKHVNNTKSQYCEKCGNKL